jgi:hypothetical protein
MIRSSDEKIGDTEYFKLLNEYLEDDNVIRTFADYLKKVDVPENFAALKMPRTRYQDDLKEASRPIHELWLMWFASHNSELSEVSMYPNEVWRDFSEFCERNGYKYDGMTSTKLGIRLNNLFVPKTRDRYITTEKNGARKKTFYIEEILQYYGVKK